LKQIDPAELSPGEFIQMIRLNVEQNDTRILVIDTLNGYLTSMPQEQELILQLHELLSFLNQRGVLTLLIVPQNGMLGSLQTSLNISYIADTILLLRFFEASGHVRKALSIVKNRAGPHEDTIRELRIDTSGLRIGEVLEKFQGVLTGTPIYTGNGSPLLQDRADPDA
jgi:circadian clock protein KaiC